MGFHWLTDFIKKQLLQSLKKIFKMRYLSVLFFVVFTTLFVNAQQTIEGLWNTGTDNTTIEISKLDGTIVGKTYSSDNSAIKKGKVIIKDVTSKKGVWQGKLYAAKKEKWLDATFVKKGNKLVVTISSGLMSRTIEWTATKI